MVEPAQIFFATPKPPPIRTAPVVEELASYVYCIYITSVAVAETPPRYIGPLFKFKYKAALSDSVAGSPRLPSSQHPEIPRTISGLLPAVPLICTLPVKYDAAPVPIPPPTTSAPVVEEVDAVVALIFTVPALLIVNN